jgi:hypothetical protein
VLLNHFKYFNATNFADIVDVNFHAMTIRYSDLSNDVLAFNEGNGGEKIDSNK